MKPIDCDVHPLLPDSGDSLLPYLPRVMRERLGARDLALANPLPASRFPHPGGHILRPDSAPPNGGPPGSDVAHTVADLLEREDPVAAVLMPIQAAGISVWTNVSEATALASAFNDFFIEHWLGYDDRFRLNIVVAPQDPQAAAAEVRRLAGTPRVCGVWVPLLDTLMGHRHYHPIYEAANEAGLPIALHPNGSEGIYQDSPSFAGGTPSSYAERFVNLHQFAQASLSSLIFEGLPEAFPNVQFVFTEMGWTWLPSVLWRMDSAWKAARTEVPWVKRPPSEYVRERVRFTTQPVDEPERHQRHYIAQIAEMMAADEVLMFSSDYPHWDSEQVSRVMRVMPEEMRDRIFYQTAADTYKIPVPAAV